MLCSEFHEYVAEVTESVTAMMKRRHGPDVKFRIIFPLDNPNGYSIYRSTPK